MAERCENVNVTDFMKRATKLMKVFYKNDRLRFIDSLYEEKFISQKVHKNILGKVKNNEV